MALFIDGNISAADDLAAHDSNILDVASTEGIDLTKKIRLAQNDLALELATLLPAGDSLDNLVVTSALQLWHTFHTLELVYRDAYSNQLNDRYAAKRDQFAALAQWAADKLIQTGLSMSSKPLPKAGPAQLSYVAGSQKGATYYVSTCWVGAYGDQGAAGDYASIVVPDYNVLSVQTSHPPANAASWSVFVGITPDTITLQNQSPLPLGQPWVQPGSLTSNGPQPGTGQSADFTRIIARTLQRG